MCAQIGADILKRALAYPARQIAKNAGVNGNVVIAKVFIQKSKNPSAICSKIIIYTFYQLTFWKLQNA